MKIINILHHYDADGRCAAAVAKWFLRSLPEYELRYLEIDHGWPIPEFTPGSILMILDFSLPVENIQKLLSQEVTIVWVDHHKTALKKAEAYPVSLPGLRNEDIAGCELTWKWFTSPEVKQIFPTLEVSRMDKHGTPDAVLFIADRDAWPGKYISTRDFCAGMLTVNTNPTEQIWMDLFSGKTAVSEVMQWGRICDRYLKLKNSSLIKKGFNVMMDGYRGFAVNGVGLGRDAFAPLDDQGYDLFIVFHYNGREGYWKITAYTAKGLDVSNLAVLRGGGGHAGACGWEVKGTNFPF